MSCHAVLWQVFGPFVAVSLLVVLLPFLPLLCPSNPLPSPEDLQSVYSPSTRNTYVVLSLGK